MPPTIMILFSWKRVAHELITTYQDWQKEGLQVLFYGETSKSKDTFLMLKWEKPIPEQFYHQMLADDDIVDYLVLPHPLPV